MRLERKNHGRGHSYHLTDDNGDTRKLPGVTSIINDGKPKQLTAWAARVTADAALNDWDRLATEPPSTRISFLAGAPQRELAAAAQRGTQIHGYVWALITGEPVDIPDEHLGAVQAAARLMDMLRMVPVLREVPVFHVKHMWAGTIDLLADLDGDRWLLDWKTGRSLFDDVALQLAAYNHAQHWADEQGNPHPWTPAPRVGVLHITPDDAQLHEVDAGDDVYTAFRYCQQVAGWTGRAREAWRDGIPWPIGAALRPAPQNGP